MDLISSTLRSSDEGRVWVTREQIDALWNNKAALQIFLGLIYAENESSSKLQFISNRQTVTLKQFLDDVYSRWDAEDGRNFVADFHDLALKASEVAEDAKIIIDSRKKNEMITLVQYAEYASTFSDFLKSSVNLLPRSNANNPRLGDVAKDVTKFTLLLDNALHCYHDINSKNYTSLILHSSIFLNTLLTSKIYSEQFRNNYVRYGTFMANIILAETPEELENAIEAAVLPAGSSSIKRETEMNISVNSFIGPFAGENICQN